MGARQKARGGGGGGGGEVGGGKVWVKRACLKATTGWYRLGSGSGGGGSSATGLEQKKVKMLLYSPCSSVSVCMPRAKQAHMSQPGVG